MSAPMRPSPLSFDSGRQSPFKRQNSASPVTVRATTPTPSPTKTTPALSPSKQGSLSPEKTSPFVRRPSQIGNPTPFERPSSPFARPTSGLGVPGSPTRQTSIASTTSKSDDSLAPTRAPSEPRTLEREEEKTTSIFRPSPSPSPFDGPPPPSVVEPLAAPFPSQANLRPAALRIGASSTTSMTKPSSFISTPPSNTNKPAPRATAAPKFAGSGGYNHVPQPLLRSMRESFEVLDSANAGAITSASVQSMLEQMGLDASTAGVRDFFPPNGPAQLNLARYLDTLSAPMSELSHADELAAAFGAFDVDDSGQIDVAELRRALVGVAPERGEEAVGLSERDVDGILAEFSARRAFGAKGLNAGKAKGEVFRYRDFMANITGGVADAAGVSEAGVVA